MVLIHVAQLSLQPVALLHCCLLVELAALRKFLHVTSLSPSAIRAADAIANLIPLAVGCLNPITIVLPDLIAIAASGAPLRSAQFVLPIPD
jgi:hypothetical protein